MKTLNKSLELLTAMIATAVVSAVVSLLLAFAALGVGNASYFAVASDSMAPLMHRGDLVVTSSSGRLDLGDAVTFRKYGQLVTHRLAEFGRQPGTYETRGDANAGNDPWTITSRDVVGKVRGVVTNAGWPLLWMSTIVGRVLLCAAFLAAVFAALWALPRALYTQAVP